MPGFAGNMKQHAGSFGARDGKLTTGLERGWVGQGMFAKTVARLAGLGILAGVYFAAAKFGLALAFVHPSATAVWPPTGIAIAAALVLGYRVWPAFLAGAFLANVSTAGSPATSLGIAVGNTCEGLLGAYLVSRLAGGRHCFERPRGVLEYAFLAAVVAPTVSATIGVISLSIGGFAAWSDFGSIWLTWWLGDAAGALIVGPFLILWSRPVGIPTPRRLVEAGFLFATVAVIGLVVFLGLHPLPVKDYPFEFLAVPALVWAALRFGPRETAAATLVLSGIAIWGTVLGIGPFARESPNESLLLLQAFMGVVELTSLALAAAVVARREAEESLRATEERLNLIRQRRRAEEALATAQAIAHVGSWEWDIQSDEIAWSDELYRIYGLSPAEFAATYEGFLAHVHPDDRERVDSIVRTACQDARPFDFIERIVRPDGTIRVLNSRGEVFTDAVGKAAKMVGTCQDVTELKQAEEDRALLAREHEARAHAQAAVRQRDEFLSVAAHELKTPVTSLRLFADLLRRQLADATVPERAIRRSAEVIDQQAEKLSALVTQLLDITRIEAGKLLLSRQPVDITSLVTQVAARAGLHAVDRRITVIPAPATIAAVDSLRLEQVITSLLDNALKYSPPDSLVDVEVRPASSDKVEIIVRDRGAGVPPQDQPHIFERFYQAHVQPHDPGLGLGLYISRQIVELHGGELVGEFPQDGGSRFVIRLPAAVGDAADKGAMPR